MKNTPGRVSSTANPPSQQVSKEPTVKSVLDGSLSSLSSSCESTSLQENEGDMETQALEVITSFRELASSVPTTEPALNSSTATAQTTKPQSGIVRIMERDESTSLITQIMISFHCMFGNCQGKEVKYIVSRHAKNITMKSLSQCDHWERARDLERMALHKLFNANSPYIIIHRPTEWKTKLRPVLIFRPKPTGALSALTADVLKGGTMPTQRPSRRKRKRERQ